MDSIQALFRLPDPAQKASEAAEGVGELKDATDEMTDVADKVSGSLKIEMDENFNKMSLLFDMTYKD